jgi:hypothetical protein
MEAKDIIFSGGINTDDEARLIPNGDFRMSKYTRSGSAESQNQGAMESMPGNLLHDNPDLPAGLNTVIGSARWIEGSSIIYMVHNSAGDHTIWSYNINDFSITLVLGNWLLGNGGTALNFQLSNKVYHTNIVDNLLYWTDGYFDSFEYNVDGLLQFNPPRKIDINKAIKYMDSDGADPEGYPVNAFSTIDEAFYTMDAAKHPPLFSPACEYFDNTDISFNKLRGNQYQFRYQYIFDNNEESKWSPITKLPLPVYDEFLGGADTVNPTRDNSINIEVETGPHLVKKIRVAYRIGENGVWGAFVEMDKKDLGLIDPDNQTFTVIFNGNTQIKPATYTEYNFDSIPQVASCQEILSNNSIVYGNYYTDYDLLTDIDMEINRVVTPYDYVDINGVKLTNVAGHIISYYDPNGIDSRFVGSYKTVFAVGPLPFPTQNPYGSYIDFRASDYWPTMEEGDVLSFGLCELDDAETSYTIYYTITAADIADFGDFQQNFCDYINTTYPGLGFAQPFAVSPYSGGGYGPDTIIHIDNALVGPVDGTNTFDVDERIYWYRRNKVTKSLKTGSKKVFGIQYYDRANRSGSVQYKASNIIQAELDVPFPSQETDAGVAGYKPYTVSAELTINHYPPDWATHYQILVKKDETILNFQQRGFTKIEVDPESYTSARLKISLESYYLKTYKGATINQTPQKGDIVRFLRRYSNPISLWPGPMAASNMTWLGRFGRSSSNYGYCSEYLELEVLEFLPGGGFDASDAIIVNNFDWQTVLGTRADDYGGLLEIYSIKKEQEDDIWFEIGCEFAIEDPHTETRYHYGNVQNQDAGNPAIVDIDYGDVYCRLRDMGKGVLEFEVSVGEQDANDTNHILYWIEDPNYSDFYNSDNHGRGRFGVDDVNAKRRHLKSSVIHSLPLVQDSNINGLSAFQGLGSSRYLDDTFGSINRLKQVGYTLKALQDRKETAIYIQKSYATGGDGAGQLAYTDKVFGGINPYDTLFGTVHPGSVQLIEGDLYYFDYHTGAFIRTSNNGQNDISSGKYKFNYYTSTKANDISLDFNNYEIISMIDEQNMEYTNFFKKYDETQEILNCRITETGYVISVINSPENLINLLPPGTSILLSGSSPTNDTYNTVVSVELVGTDDYDITVTNEVTLPSNIPFRILLDVYSTEGVVFSYLRDRWITMVDYTPMWAETLGIINVSWDVNGQVYSHNDGDELNFYTDQKTQMIDFVMNESAITIKRLLTMGIRSNGVFNVDSVTTPVSGSYPAMNSEIPAALFKLKEGYYWSAYLRDKTNVNTSDPYLRTVELALQNGRQLRGYVFEHTISQSSTSKVVLFSIKTTYVPSEALI